MVSPRCRPGRRQRAVHSRQHVIGWYLAADAQGNAAARAQNYAEAAKWYRLAADQGHAGAQDSLGIMYHFMPQDYVRAHMWFNLSAAQGHPRCCEKER